MSPRLISLNCLFCLLLVVQPLLVATVPARALAAPVDESPQLYFPLIAGAIAAQNELTSPVSATAIEASEEFNFLRAYVSAYHISQNQMTLFGEWRQSAWSNNYVDTSYYRTICNSAAVAAMVAHDEPDNPNVDLTRAKAILLAAINEYADNPYTGAGPEARDGWGYPTPGNATDLNFDTGFVGYPCLVAVALLWDDLNSSDKLDARALFADLANRLYQYRTASFFDNPAAFSCGNSPAEEITALASFLAALSQFDRNHPQANDWRLRAQQLMDYAFNKSTTNSLNFRAGCNVPPDGLNYNNTVTNHRMYPHSVYGFSVVNDVARTLLPWSAQGITVNANPVVNITNLDAGTGNDKFYGEGWDLSALLNVYYANLAYVNGVNAKGAIVSADFSLRGNTYNASNLNSVIDFRQKSYLGVSGVSDWGFGLDFQNGALALVAWLDMSLSPSLGTYYYNYAKLRAYQAAQLPGSGYFPRLHANGCAGPVQTASANWSWNYLPKACPARMNGVLVPFFDGMANYQLSSQVNSHFFLNSFSAFNHLVAYLYMRNALWPPDFNGNSTLPDFSAQ